MIGQSEAFRALEYLISQIAVYDAPVLIEGETGTGKELAARAIHYSSARKDQPFVPVNCGALPDTLIENELFGHARGAYTDARDSQPGLIALASPGTLFLDEVDALTPRGQITLLRFLQDQHFRPLGGRQELLGNVRIFAASNRSLDRLVEAGLFRQDLLYRLKLLELKVPPLRDRKDDIAVLANHFVATASLRFGKPAKPIHPDTLAWFQLYSWPGNIRELENLVHREFLMAQGGMIEVAPPAALRTAKGRDAPTSNAFSYLHAKRVAIHDFENRFLRQLIAQTGGNISAAARLCGTERRHLGRLIRKHHITKP